MGQRITRTLECCTLGAGLVVLAGVLAPSALAYDRGGEGDDPPSGHPALSIELSGDPERLRAGEEVEYTLTLTNDGEDTLHGATLSQSLPEEFEVTSARQASVRSESTVGWEVSLPPGEEAERVLRVRIADELEENAWRIATTACAQLGADGPPAVCATEAGLIDSGEPVEQRAGQPPKDETGLFPPRVTGAAVVLGVLIAAFLAPLFARRRHRPRSGTG
ncbi:NEW3 domain-containing protein [Allosalinactinospora lopnorensis]|uniref:NEW3 domain-containing protein n=1 Tax=Allosalinactinospora lopnorensis TaxID=1352348 RepID=UPI00138F6286|nr:NEW3 domain-containing protein [Allosalinactinospora lopnorensis]